MKKISLMLFVVILFGGCDSLKEYFSSSDKKEAKKGTASSTEDTLYTLGLDIARSLQVFSLTEKELDIVMKGLKDYHENDKTEYDKQLEAGRQDIRKLATDRKAIQDKENIKKGADFIEKYSKQKGVKTTESGIAYKIIEAGSAERPLPTSTITVNYKGTLIDGTVFDSSYDRGKPATFQLNRVIKGWAEGMKLIGKGGKAELVIPSKLAYGERGNRSIPGNSVLIFEVELLEIDNTPPPAPKKKK
ncbi:MAG: FKBP-type peptidyl-prolyl cis-trans isomerase [Spirochaetes bacterium]|nr:FKBP-type peptidyl-prolyl cis-trans isomerase [Spirochaetota bacterium]